jgi:integrase
MPANLLTANEVKNAKLNPKRPDVVRRLSDGKGLWLEIRPVTGAKFWRYRFKLNGKEKLYTIGPAGYRTGEIGLEEARKERARLRDLVKQGLNPTQERRERKDETIREGENTFKALAERWIVQGKPHWAEKYHRDIRQAMDKTIFPKIGNRPIKAITSGEVRAVVESMKSKPVTAKRFLLWIGSVCRYAIAEDIAEEDPTYALRNLIKRPKVRHHQPIPLETLPEIIQAARDDGGDAALRLGLELLAHTFVRPSELIGARWSEIDFDKALWTIPAERMKMRDAHYVPLSSQAVTILRELEKITGRFLCLFPNRRDPRRAAKASNLNRLVERMGYGDVFSPHAFRATASTKLNELSYSPDWIELQLGHAPRNKIRASYNQARWLEERRAMMQSYSDLITTAGQGDKVVPIRKQEAAA